MQSEELEVLQGKTAKVLWTEDLDAFLEELDVRETHSIACTCRAYLAPGHKTKSTNFRPKSPLSSSLKCPKHFSCYHKPCTCTCTSVTTHSHTHKPCTCTCTSVTTHTHIKIQNVELRERQEEAEGCSITAKKKRAPKGKAAGRQAKLTAVGGGGNSEKSTKPSPFAEAILPVIPEFSAEPKKPATKREKKTDKGAKLEEEGEGEGGEGEGEGEGGGATTAAPRKKAASRKKVQTLEDMWVAGVSWPAVLP